MAANTGWYSQQWFSGYFPPVWFAPGDESHLAPSEIRTGGVPRRRIVAQPGWWHPAPVPADPAPVDDDEALLLCGVI